MLTWPAPMFLEDVRLILLWIMDYENEFCSLLSISTDISCIVKIAVFVRQVPSH